ncbi:hypothetical protein [Tardiphaga sp.]|jgi:hypothetical protein|uniref:hypothetical protein n=1 Tax=Tardiphaga sp. TaxID=1926292 RepID=UPI0037D9FDC8
MSKNVMTSSEIIQVIESEAIRQLGPWPQGLDIFIYRLEYGWECLITYTDDPVASKYRAAALRIGQAQENIIALRD